MTLIDTDDNITVQYSTILLGDDEDDGGDDGQSCDSPVDAVFDNRLHCAQNGFLCDFVT